MPRFTRKELNILETFYTEQSYTTPEQNAKIAENFGRSPASIANWFRARRRKSTKLNHKPASLTKTLKVEELLDLQRQLHSVRKKIGNSSHQSVSLVSDTNSER